MEAGEVEVDVDYHHADPTGVAFDAAEFGEPAPGMHVEGAVQPQAVVYPPPLPQ